MSHITEPDYDALLAAEVEKLRQAGGQGTQVPGSADSGR